MRCPNCGKEDDKVIDTRPNEGNTIIRRRRACLNCGHRFTTHEKIEEYPLFVVKKNGLKEPFDRSKLLQGLIRSCYKRQVTSESLEELVNYVEQVLRSKMVQEVSTQEIGNIVIEELRKIDEVAYVRFASVYRQFKDVNAFLNELKYLWVSGNNKNLDYESQENEENFVKLKNEIVDDNGTIVCAGFKKGNIKQRVTKNRKNEIKSKK